MPRKFTKSLNTNVSQTEYQTVQTLAGEFGIAVYLRSLIIADAARRGVEWPGETVGRGKYDRNR